MRESEYGGRLVSAPYLVYTHNGVIVGATFVAARAGESLPLLTLAVAQ